MAFMKIFFNSQACIFHILLKNWTKVVIDEINIESVNFSKTWER